MQKFKNAFLFAFYGKLLSTVSYRSFSKLDTRMFLVSCKLAMLYRIKPFYKLLLAPLCLQSETTTWSGGW